MTPRKRDFNHLYSKFGEETFGGKGPLMFEKLEEKLQDYKKSHPGATVNHQIYEGDETPLIVAIVSPLMKRVPKRFLSVENLFLLIPLLIQKNTI